jgi:hypothetical protein
VHPNLDDVLVELFFGLGEAVAFILSLVLKKILWIAGLVLFAFLSFRVATAGWSALDDPSVQFAVIMSAVAFILATILEFFDRLGK